MLFLCVILSYFSFIYLVSILFTDSTLLVCYFCGAYFCSEFGLSYSTIKWYYECGFNHNDFYKIWGWEIH